MQDTRTFVVDVVRTFSILVSLPPLRSYFLFSFISSFQPLKRSSFLSFPFFLRFSFFLERNKLWTDSVTLTPFSKKKFVLKSFSQNFFLTSSEKEFFLQFKVMIKSFLFTTSTMLFMMFWDKWGFHFFWREKVRERKREKKGKIQNGRKRGKNHQEIEGERKVSTYQHTISGRGKDAEEFSFISKILSSSSSYHIQQKCHKIVPSLCQHYSFKCSH